VLLSTSKCSQTPLELRKVQSDSARAFSNVTDSTCRYGGAFRMLQDLTYRIGKFWSSWDLCADLGETSRLAETAAQPCERLREQWGPLSIAVENLVVYTHSSGYYMTTRHFILLYSSLLQSQDLLLHQMACIVTVSLYIYIDSIWPEMIVEHNHRGAWTCPLTQLRDAPLGCCCGKTM